MTLVESMKILEFVCMYSCPAIRVIFCKGSGNHFVVRFFRMYLGIPEVHFLVVRKFSSV